MNLKTLLIAIKEILISCPNLKKEKIDNEVYRLYFLNFPTVKSKVKTKLDLPLSCFKLPENMTRQEAFMLLSYIKDLVEKEYPKHLNELQKAILVDSLLESFGFIILSESDLDNITDLFIISGDRKKFTKSVYYSRYIDWYIEKVIYDEVILIKDCVYKRTIKRKEK